MKKKFLLTFMALLGIGAIEAWADAPTDDQYQAALTNITDGTYKIYAESGNTKYYLKVDVKSQSGNECDFVITTDKADEAATFDVSQVDISGLQSKSWLIANGDWAFTNATGGNSSDATFSAGTYLRGYLYGNRRDDQRQFDRQVLYLKDGKVAVRCTNNNGVAWGSSAYWGIDTNNNACYVADASFIWHFEEVIDAKHPKDVTSKYLKNTTFDGDISGWTTTGFAYKDTQMEFWSNSANQTVDAYQEVTLPAGFYVLKCDAFQRNSDKNKQSDFQSGNDSPAFALYAGDNQIQLKSLYAYSSSYADNNTQAKTVIANYPNALPFYLSTETKLRLGVKNIDETAAKCWVIVDNFTLTYYGNTAAEQTLESANPTENGTGRITLNREFTANNWSTLVVPFDVPTSAIPNGMTVAQLVKEDENRIGFSTKYQFIEANKPVLVKFSSNTTNPEFENGVVYGGQMVGSVTAPTGSDISLVGTYTEVLLTAADNGNAYVVKDNKLYNVDSDVNIKPFRGYFTYAKAASARSLAFLVDDDIVTAIGDINVSPTVNNGKVYDLYGRRIATQSKGIYIVNGKKYVAK